MAWSYMLEYENNANPDKDISQTIATWESLASNIIGPAQNIPDQAKAYQRLGIGAKDALHIACAEAAGADFFLTVDKGILKRRDKVPGLKIVSPLEFIEQEE